MTAVGDDNALVGDQVLAYVERLQSLEDAEAVTDSLLDHVRPFGFTTLAYGEVSVRHPDDGTFFFNRWPPTLIEAYFDAGMGAADFLIPTAKRSTLPFTWQEAYRPYTSDRKSIELMDFLAQYSFNDGLAVPLHQSGGRVGMVSLSAERMDISPRERTALRVAGIMTYLKGQELTAPAKPVVGLTPRETEVMHWVAAGKSDPEIGEILTISQSTTHFHVENAKRKLDSATRAQAAARAVYLGLIKP